LFGREDTYQLLHGTYVAAALTYIWLGGAFAYLESWHVDAIHFRVNTSPMEAKVWQQIEEAFAL
jgi:hypothetical protein